jgi:predicted permease
MEALFVERHAGACARGPAAVAAIWVRAALDVARAWPRAIRRRALARGQVGIPSPGRHSMLGSDIRYAFRSLSRQRAGSVLVILMLALGLAANVAVFSLVNGLFFRPFPFDEADRLVYINERAPKWNLDRTGINFPDFDVWRRSQQRFEAIAIYDRDDMNLSDGQTAERLSGALVTHEFDEVLRLQPVLGRLFTADDDRPGGPDVMVIGQGLWHERFSSDPGVLGRTLKLNGRQRTIIGVLPLEADAYPGGARLWLPMQENPLQEGQSYSYDGIGRLKPGVAIAEAEQDLLRTHQEIFDTRDRERIVSPFVLPLREIHVRDFRAAATTLMVAVVLLLVIASANVASVMLARALARRREMGIRVAVGASRLRLVRQLFVENLMLAAVGGALGLAMGQAGIAALIDTLPEGPPQWARFSLDARVVVFALGASFATVLLFGWAPALHALRGDLRAAMVNVANAPSSSPGGGQTLRLIVGTEFALATLLVVCGALLGQAYQRVQNVDPGFDPHNVLTFRVSLPGAVYREEARRLAFWDRLQARLAELPGVRSAGLVNCPPFSCHWGQFYLAEGMPRRSEAEGNPVVLNRVASPDYFRTIGVRLKSGRFFTPADGRRGETQDRVVIINETFARTFFPGVADPVGRRIRSTGDEAPSNLIVGYVADVKHYGLEQPMRPGVYWPLGQITLWGMAVVLKTERDPASVTASARAAVAELDPELPLFDVRTMDAAVQRSMALRVTYSWMLAVFAVTALVLALGGTYGVSSYLVGQRTREIGIRVALGAAGTDIVRGVLRTSLTVAAAGIFVGVAASFGLTRLLESLLFGVNPHEGWVLIGAVALLAGASLAANLLPARRAARVDPMLSLRAE